MLNIADMLNKVSKMNLQTKHLYISSAVPGVGTSFTFQPITLDGGKWHLILAGGLLHTLALPNTESLSLSYSIIIEASEAVKVPFDFHVMPGFEREIKLYPTFMKIPENSRISITSIFPDLFSPSFVEVKMIFAKA